MSGWATRPALLFPLAAALLCVAACGVAHPAPPQPLTLSRERVVSRGAWLDVQAAPQAYRSVGTAPLVGPYYILISYGGRYCVVDASAFARAHDDQLWTCEWHYPHPAPGLAPP